MSRTPAGAIHRPPFLFERTGGHLWPFLLRRWSSEELEDGVADGGQSRLRRWPVDSFFPSCCCKAAILEEGIRDHRHKRMTVEALPGSSLEVIETEFFFQLRMSLLANPSRLDGRRQGAQVGLCRQVGE